MLISNGMTLRCLYTGGSTLKSMGRAYYHVGVALSKSIPPPMTKPTLDAAGNAKVVTVCRQLFVCRNTVALFLYVYLSTICPANSVLYLSAEIQ